MPKVTEQKKPVKSQPKTPEAVKTTPVKEPEPKVVVFRLFECQMHLEEALAQIKKVGIFPGPESRSDEFKAKLKTAELAVAQILKDYQVAWGEMQKQ